MVTFLLYSLVLFSISYFGCGGEFDVDYNNSLRGLLPSLIGESISLKR